MLKSVLGLVSAKRGKTVGPFQDYDIEKTVTVYAGSRNSSYASGKFCGVLIAKALDH